MLALRLLHRGGGASGTSRLVSKRNVSEILKNLVEPKFSLPPLQRCALLFFCGV